MITINALSLQAPRLVCALLIFEFISLCEGYSNKGKWISVNQDDEIYPAGKEPYLRCDTPVTSIQESSSFFMFGGTQDAYSVYTLGDTWIYSAPNNTWTNITCSAPSCSPPPRRSHSAAYVSDRNAVFIYGGYTFNLSNVDLPPVFYGDLHEFSTKSNIWTAITTLGEVPSPRAGAALAYDPVANRLIMFGGVTKPSGNYFSTPWQYLNDTWEFSLDALKWTQIKMNVVMQPTENNQAVYVADSQAVFLYGGTVECEEDRLGSFLETICISDTLFQFDCLTNTWEEVHTKGNIPPLQGFVSDTISSSQFFIHGGCSNYSRNEDEELYCTESQPDIFVFDTATFQWTKISADGGPLLWYHGGGYSAESVIVLFGGIAGNTVYLNNFVWSFEFTYSVSSWATAGVITAWIILGAVVIWISAPKYLFRLWALIRPRKEDPETESILIITESVEEEPSSDPTNTNGST